MRSLAKFREAPSGAFKFVAATATIGATAIWQIVLRFDSRAPSVLTSAAGCFQIRKGLKNQKNYAGDGDGEARCRS